MYEKEQRNLWNGIVKIADATLREREELYIKGRLDDMKSSKNKPQIFIDQLYKQRDQFTYEDIIQETNTLVMAVSILIFKPMTCNFARIFLFSNLHRKIS